MREMKRKGEPRKHKHKAAEHRIKVVNNNFSPICFFCMGFCSYAGALNGGSSKTRTYIFTF